MAPRSLSAQLCEAFTPLSRFEGPLLSQAPALNHSRLEPKWLPSLSLPLSPSLSVSLSLSLALYLHLVAQFLQTSTVATEESECKRNA